MPKRPYPPTPASSMDISPQDRLWASPDTNLHLPPPAIHSGSQSTAHASPPSPTNPPTASPKDKGPITLPSPPSRTRKIIQMNPPTQSPSQTRAPSTKRRKTTATSTAVQPPNPSTTTTAPKPSKKTIRKTAHSLIERRRRSKMNTAFATLREMIPACRTNTSMLDDDTRPPDKTREREMHKLDVLNAGIDYIRYLEGCVDSLRSGGSEATAPHQQQQQQQFHHLSHPQDQTRSLPPPSRKSTSNSISSARSTTVLPHPSRKVRTASQQEMPPSPPPSLGPRPRDFPREGERVAPRTLDEEGEGEDGSEGMDVDIDEDGEMDDDNGKDEDDEDEAEDDGEATHRTAAALLMLTAGERRGTGLVGTKSEVAKVVAAAVERQVGNAEGEGEGRRAGKALRVRDLLLN